MKAGPTIQPRPIPSSCPQTNQQPNEHEHVRVSARSTAPSNDFQSACAAASAARAARCWQSQSIATSHRQPAVAHPHSESTPSRRDGVDRKESAETRPSSRAPRPYSFNPARRSGPEAQPTAEVHVPSESIRVSRLASFGTATRALGAIPAGTAFPATLRSGRAESLRPGRPRSAPGRRLLWARNGQTGLSAPYPATALSFSVTLPFPPGLPPSLSPPPLLSVCQTESPFFCPRQRGSGRACAL